LIPKKVIEAKLLEARKTVSGKYFVEDVSLKIHQLNDFPGPLIKWMLKSVGAQGVYDIAKNLLNTKATAVVTIGYTDGEQVQYFEGSIEGNIVAPKGETAFGWDPIFQPEGYTKTFGEMTKEEKNAISSRKLAAEKLTSFLEKK
jgi:inosine triphosphate pyrophosphatase